MKAPLKTVLNRIFLLKIGMMAISALLFFSACTSLQPEMAGSVTEGGNVSGRIVDSTGHNAPGVLVQLIPMQYNPVAGGALSASYYDTSADDGTYSFREIGPGSYNMMALQIEKRTRAMANQILVEDSATIVPITLQHAGAITIALPSTVDTVNGYVYIPGTTISVPVKSRNPLLIDSLPAGNIPAVYYAEKTTLVHDVLRYNIAVIPGSTTKVFMPLWNYSRKLHLNTTASGAGISSNVIGFPALVRLTSDNFTFDDAGNNGEDIRFTKANGTLLPHEIERWDPVAELADVWVRIDTIFGNDSLHYITMKWGNAETTGQSNSAAVFDTADGFEGVWHLSGTSGLLELDATYHHYDATPMGAVVPSDTTGVIGTAKKFDGTSGYLDMQNTASSSMNFAENDFFTISAWVKLDADSTPFQAIVYKGTYQWALETDPENFWEFNDYRDSTGWTRNRFTVAKHTWKYLTGVRAGAKQYLYVDGTCVDSLPTLYTPTSGIWPRNTASNVQLSHCADGTQGERFLDGAIDETIVSGVARSSDWIKLCYMNQKSRDLLFVFK